MPVLAINQLQMYYQHFPNTASDAPPLLLLSGMASDSASWQPVIEPLSRHFELIIPDNRCSGRTQPCPVETSRALMVNDVLVLLDALEIEKANILGHSMGGMLGWALAANAPDRVNHLISASAQAWVIPARVALFDSLACMRSDQNEEHWFALLYQFLFSPSFFEHATTVRQALEASMSYEHKQSVLAFQTQAAALNSFLEPIELDAVRCPVSLVTGSNDLLMTPDLMKLFCDEQGYPFSIIPDAAHALHWEQTQAFVEFVTGELGVG